ncbi:Uncharacterized conserved protein GlcG, DUF336 family [Azotobacter beijerinckii]|uniref:Uncharacterized conserved protein GlcG, DUF336 family n=1 Tax=Azotobacter beijerinckii TaxID=170623 RepID=A0A1H6R8Z5_9GAMM|nr:heme-binding protein [Azotobacter beijerinckii]SEI48260.1 Uncharacterized conserved protein GlcG, DUF336 family [Azotobacter beijerinckii]SEI86442.1 Uncharacterized conserved protein GlcG, DUF336 family [Azotobacter beijerinckii]SFB36675.1 Uncharacterized conserved protein GlcG, DUF336 family [Azotobacter beijerinckii]SFK92451.1 Uncharacterized conserved protein GlcG, DUF336 family [Azotobacter beijerinckii]
MKRSDSHTTNGNSRYLRQVGTVTLPLAMQALQAALDKAAELSVRVSVSVVDAAGHLIHLAHMDGATLQSRDIALNKALTAVGFGFSTSAWEARLESRSAAVRQGLPLQPRIALFGGGEPFLQHGVAVGAIGVSGASEQEDVLCARAAVHAVESLLGEPVQQ